MQVEDVEAMDILNVHCVAESLAQTGDGDCDDVGKDDRVRILNLDAQC